MRYLLPVLCLLHAVSCSTLTKTQIDEVEHFAKAGTGVSTAAGDAFKKMYLLKSDIEFFNAADENKPGDVIAQLDKCRRIKDTLFAETVRDYASGYDVLAAYTSALLEIINPAYNKEFKETAGDLETNFDSLISKYNSVKADDKKIPLEFGKIFAKGIEVIGSRHIAAQQKKFIKEAVEAAAPVLDLVCDNFIQVDVKILQTRLGSIRNDIVNAYKQVAGQALLRDSTISPLVFYKELNPVYLELMVKHDELNALVKKLSGAMQNFKEGHKILSAALNSKTDRKTFIENTKALWSDFTSIRDLYKQYQKEKENIRNQAAAK
jgi:hypothetical protein